MVIEGFLSVNCEIKIIFIILGIKEYIYHVGIGMVCCCLCHTRETCAGKPESTRRWAFVRDLLSYRLTQIDDSNHSIDGLFLWCENDA